ncbi:MAG TPA: hypothetical protein VD793_01855 [Gemmatimonadales bacterium]|nr:hypothetical protein [Gemmatimonadales bacterium]
MSGVAIVSPGFPHRAGGVTDHTGRLVRHWGRDRRVVTLGPVTGHPDHLALGWQAAGVSALLLQYVPFLYGRRGLSTFPRRVCLAARARGIRVTTFVHEPWVPPTRLPWWILSPLQRRQLRNLLAVSDAAVTPVPAWVGLLWNRPQVLAVGSTLGDAPAEPAGPPLDAPVLFSPFASGLSWSWIASAVEAIGAHPPLIVLGATRETARQHHAARRWQDSQWEWTGFLPPADALGLLARARLVLAPFEDGLTGRRTSALAALSAGARLVSSRGHLFDPTLEGGPVQFADSRADFARLAANTWGEPDDAVRRAARLHWYRQHLDPRDLDDRLLTVVLGATP